MSQTTARRRAAGRSGAAARAEARRLARERMLRRRRRTALVVVLVLAVAIVGIDMLHGTGDPPHTSAAAAAPRASHSTAPSPRPSAAASATPTAATVTYPYTGSGKFVTATGRSKVYGTSGTLLRFQVQVESDIKGIGAQGFADTVVSILGNSQSWTAGGLWRFQLVGPGQAHDFTLHLVTPATRDAMCQDGQDGYTSCRFGDDVMINVVRWTHGAPTYTDLTRYREYAINHEVGHRLGHGHQLCPGKGKKAPVMQQQTLGLHGCVDNPWPYPGGNLYEGEDGEYPQDIPTDPASWFTD